MLSRGDIWPKASAVSASPATLCNSFVGQTGQVGGGGKQVEAATAFYFSHFWFYHNVEITFD